MRIYNMNRRGKINVQGVLNSDRSYNSRLSNFNYSQNNRAAFTPNLSNNRTASTPIPKSNSLNLSAGVTNNNNTGLTASSIKVTNFLYKVTGTGVEAGNQYNATDAHYIDKLKKLPINRYQSGYKFTINKVIVRGGRKKALVQILPNSKIQNLRGAHKEKPNQVELDVLVQKGNDETKCRIVVYYSGIVTVQMGVLGDFVIGNTARTLLTQQVDAINQGIIQTYFSFIKGKGKFTNISGQFNFNKGFNVERFRGLIPSLKNVTDVKLPEMEAPLVRFIFNYDGVTCMIFPFTGMCQMMGATSLDQLTKTKNYMLDEFGAYKHMLIDPIVRPKAINKKKKKTKVPKAVLCPKSRRPDEKTGKCPLETQHKRPNEQGDMCCYNTPKKITKSLRNKVVKAYKNANKNVPKNVKNALGITQVNKQIENNLNTLFSIMPNGTIKIKKRICSSYTKPQLVAFAAKVGIILKPKRVKSQICTDIYQEWRRRYGGAGGLNKINILANKNTGYLGLKIEDKKCGSWTKKDLINWASKRQIIIDPKLKKLQVCRVLFERANANSRFESNMMKKIPKVSVVRGKVLIHDRQLNAYSNEFFKICC